MEVRGEGERRGPYGLGWEGDCARVLDEGWGGGERRGDKGRRRIVAKWNRVGVKGRLLPEIRYAQSSTWMLGRREETMDQKIQAVEGYMMVVVEQGRKTCMV